MIHDSYQSAIAAVLDHVPREARLQAGGGVWADGGGSPIGARVEVEEGDTLHQHEHIGDCMTRFAPDTSPDV